MANTDEPRREVPRDLYPEWTTKPHQVKDRPAGVLERPRLRAIPGEGTFEGRWRFRAIALIVIVCGLALAAYFLGAERTHLRRTPPNNSALYAPDAQLEELARNRLRREADLKDLDVTVVVREQIVTVSGRVPDDQTREKVLNVVRMTPNVTGVIDHVTVGAPKK